MHALDRTAKTALRGFWQFWQWFAWCELARHERKGRYMRTEQSKLVASLLERQDERSQQGETVGCALQFRTMNGILIAFEGIDGAGKTTQALALRARLEALGETVVFSKEPTDGVWGARLRASALEGRMPLDEELTAFIEDRRDHLENRVNPALAAGSTVILDRYFYSTLAYQGARGGELASIEDRVRDGVTLPDIVFWLDLPVSEAMQRIQVRDGEGNHFEREDDLVRIGEVFRTIASRDALIVRIDASLPPEEVEKNILRAFVDGPWKLKRCAKAYGCDDPIHCTPRITGGCKWAELLKQV